MSEVELMHVHDRVLNKFVYHMCQAKGRNFTLILKAEETQAALRLAPWCGPWMQISLALEGLTRKNILQTVKIARQVFRNYIKIQEAIASICDGSRVLSCLVRYAPPARHGS